MAPQISLNTLYDIKNKKDNNKNVIFDEIILKSHKKIKEIAHQGGLSTFFEIPYVIIGKPLYKIRECIEYVVNALKKNGLLINVLPSPNNNIIYISWKPTDIKMRKQIRN